MSNEEFKLKGISKMAKEKEVIENIMQVKEGDECHHPDPRDQQFVLLLKSNTSQWQAAAH